MSATFHLPILSSSPPPSEFDVPPQSSQRHAAIPTLSPPQQRVGVPATSNLTLSPVIRPKRNTTGALKSGSRAAGIPDEARRGFATARSVIDLRDNEGRGGTIGRKEGSGCEEVRIVDIAEARKSRARREDEEDLTAKAAAKRRKAKANGPTISAHFAKTIKAAEAVNDVEETVEKVPKISKPRKPRAKKGEVETVVDPADEETAVKALKVIKPRKPRAKKGEDVVGADLVNNIEETVEKVPKISKPRKPRAKKGEVEAAGAPKAATKKRRKSDPVVSAHFKNAEDGCAAVVEKDDDIWDVPLSPPKQKPPDKKKDYPLELDEAVLRRKEWTPPRQVESTSDDALPESTGKEHGTEDTGPAVNVSFTGLLSGYAYAHAQHLTAETTTTTLAASASTTASSTTATITKCRRVDVPGNQSRQTSPHKPKPKKKPRTLTDLVMGQYEVPKEPAPVTSEFFQRQTTTTTTKIPLNDTTNRAKAPKKPTQKRLASESVSEAATYTSDAKPKRKAKAKSTTKKPASKPKPMAEKLLSPSSAVLRMNRQDILFGTSSQLALDESPTIVRQIQQAMAESELLTVEDDDRPRKRLRRLSLGKIEGKRALWKAGARDEDGELLEKLEDVYMPEPDRTQDVPLLMDNLVACEDEDVVMEEKDMDGVAEEEEPDSPFVDIDDLPRSAPPAVVSVVSPPVPPPPVILVSSDAPTPPRISNRQSPIPGLIEDEDEASFVHIDDLSQDPLHSTHEDEVDHTSFVHIEDLPQDPPPLHQHVESSFIDIDDLPTSAQIPVRSSPPPTPLPTDIMTSSPKKRRGRPPKNQSAIPRATASASPPSASVLKPLPQPEPRTPGSRRRFFGIEEIMDSEDDEALSPLPPRVRRLEDSPPLLLFSIPNKTSTARALEPSKPTKATTSKSKATTKPAKGTASKPAPQADEPLIPVHKIRESSLYFANIKPTLFANLTATIRSLPPTTNPAQPSWHEKILMYDAIILEDFTAFLNQEPRLRTWRRATLKQIRAWNKHLKAMGEEKLEVDGGNDGVGGEAEALAVEKEVEGWMVRKWCEEMSVCCVVREKQRGGGTKGLY